MDNISTETVMIASMAVVREYLLLENHLETLASDSEEAVEIGDDVLRLTKAIGELQALYLSTEDIEQYPSWEEVVELASESLVDTEEM